MNPDCLVLYDKPAGTTSFHSLGVWKRALKTKKLGHTGTLDQFASGLLVLVGGSLTRLTDIIHELEKEYVAVMKLGEETDTLDPEGVVIRNAPLASRTALEETLQQFLGPIQQTPPAYSAVKIDGKRASDRVREGEAVTIKSRSVFLSSAEILQMNGSEVTFKIVCGSGFYVRSLARDWAAAAGSAGYLTALRRTRIGPFSVDDALGVNPPGLYISAREAFDRLPGWCLPSADEIQLRQLRNGIIPLNIMELMEEKVAFFDEEGRFAAALQKVGDRWRFICSSGVH